MSKRLKNFFSVIFALAAVMSISLTANAASDELDINSVAKVKVGDKIKFSINMSDSTEEVLGICMSVFYDKEYLELDTNSITYEKFDGAVQNPNLDGYFKFSWTNINDLQDFSKKASLVSAEFKVLKSGKTEISQFITDLYGEDMTQLKSYKLTYDVYVNNKLAASDKTPIVNDDKSKEKKMQGDFINYIDGMGAENTPNKDDHPSVIADKNYVSQQIVTEVVDVTKSVVDGTSGNGGSSTVTIVIIIAVVIIALAAAAIIIVKRRDDKNV